jgi:ERCC4-type nuclease
MTLLVDQREGSRQYAKLLGVDAQLCLLDYGDVALAGNGPNGDVLVGIELKKINDVVACIGDGRYTSHQLPGMLQSYDYSYLIVEGVVRASADGLLQIGYSYPRKDSDGNKIKIGLWDGKNYGGWWSDVSAGRQRFTYRQFVNWLESISNLAGVRVLRSTCEAETVALIQSVQSWWQKDYGEHRSLQTFNESRPDAALLTKPSLRRRVAAELPGVHWVRSGALAGTFPTTFDLVNASVEQLMSVEGIGVGIASKVYDSLRSE